MGYILVFIALCVPSVLAVTSKYVYPDANGKLVYKATNGNVIPDFSNVGYHQGLSLPSAASIPVKKTIAAPTGDASATIQAAINEVSKLPLNNGYRGAVLLQQGTYNCAKTILVQAEGVVVRGTGTGTIIQLKGTTQRNGFELGAVATSIKKIGTPVLVETSVKVGAKQLTLKSVAGFKIGDMVLVTVNFNQQFLKDVGMTKFPPRKDGGEVKPWTPFDIVFHRKITAITGNVITIDAPMVQGIESRWGGGSVQVFQDGRPEHIGIESMEIRSDFKSNTDENHAKTGVAIDNCVNCWARKLIVKHVVFAGIDVARGALQSQVEDCEVSELKSVIDGGRRYNFNCDGQLSLFQRNVGKDGRHNFVFGSQVPGPNVFLDCKAEREHSTSEPHHRWSVGGLYDRVTASIAFQDRQNMGSGHGWSGANYVAWNTVGEITCQIPPGASQYSIGHSGKKDVGAFPKDKQQCDFDSFGKAVTPSSLYLAQLAERRTGKANKSALVPDSPTPKRVTIAPTNKPTTRAPTTAKPTTVPVASQCSNGIKNGQACCPKTCGACGGSGCGSLPGGGSSCCTTNVLNAAKSCATNAPPCVLADIPFNDAVCSTGIKANGICCPQSCGSCGGTGCNSRPGGGTACCSTPIVASKISCLGADPPCIIPASALLLTEAMDVTGKPGSSAFTIATNAGLLTSQTGVPLGRSVFLSRDLGPGAFQRFENTSCTQIKLINQDVCLAVSDPVPKNGASVKMARCDCNDPNQMFTYTGNQYNWAGLCLAIGPQGSALQVWDCQTAGAQGLTTQFSRNQVPELLAFLAVAEGTSPPPVTVGPNGIWGSRYESTVGEDSSYPDLYVSDDTELLFVHDVNTRVYKISEDQFYSCNFTDAADVAANIAEGVDVDAPALNALTFTTSPAQFVAPPATSSVVTAIDPAATAEDIAFIQSLAAATTDDPFVTSKYTAAFGETAYFASRNCANGVKIRVFSRMDVINVEFDEPLSVSASSCSAAPDCSSCTLSGCVWCGGACQADLTCSSGGLLGTCTIPAPNPTVGNDLSAASGSSSCLAVLPFLLGAVVLILTESS